MFNVFLESECVLYIFLKKKRTNKPTGKKKKKKIVKFILHFLLVVCFFNCYHKNEVECSSLLFASASFCHGSIGELGKPHC